MCGFTGYLLNNSTAQDSDVILKMLKLQRHRGPDDSGVMGIDMNSAFTEELPVQSPTNFSINANLIFGFNRLSILDLSSSGHQPMCNREKGVVLMMNGEVYNAFDFKLELESKGYIFKGNSDTEVVLTLYLEYGLEGMLDRLNGMFSISIYDARDKNLYLIRDRLGIKPLYILQQKDRIAFASEMKSFKAIPNFKFELDESRLSEYMLFRNSINNTLFKNIVNITPGTYLRINSLSQISHHVYYDIRNEEKRKVKSTREDLHNALKASVKRQMIADVKLGCQLSGGVDSSLVTAYASNSLPSGLLETVSIIFDEKGFSEKKYIDIVVANHNIQSHQFVLNPKNYLELIDEAIWHFEQPLNHPNTIGIKLLSKEAKKHVTVLLSGEGADESLAGYSRFIHSSNSFWSIKTLKKAFQNRKDILTFLSTWLSKEKRYLLQTSFCSISEAKAIYPKFSLNNGLSSRLKIWNSIKDNDLRKLRIYELLSYLPDLLMRQDKMSMAHTIENRVPFLDNEMIKTALNFDDKELVKLKNGKYECKFPLKEICSDLFGDNFAFRNKMGFGIPLKSFLSSEEFQNRWKLEFLPSIETRGIFNFSLLSKWMRNPEKLNPTQLDAIWLMIGFEIWAKQYLD
jgi:asparagine synthase (glutamine-hydrolysing)